MGGTLADRQADAIFRRFGDQGQAVIYLLQLVVLRDITTVCKDAALLKSGVSAELLKVQVLEDGVGDFVKCGDEIILGVESAQLLIR